MTGLWNTQQPFYQTQYTLQDNQNIKKKITKLGNMNIEGKSIK